MDNIFDSNVGKHTVNCYCHLFQNIFEHGLYIHAYSTVTARRLAMKRKNVSAFDGAINVQ